MQSSGYAWEYRTTLCFGLTTNRDDILKRPAGLPDIENLLRFVLRNIDAYFQEHFHNLRVQLTRLKAGAFSLEEFSAHLVHERRRHLATGAVMSTDKQDCFLLFHNFAVDLFFANTDIGSQRLFRS